MEQKLYLMFLQKDFQVEFERINATQKIKYYSIRDEELPLHHLYNNIWSFPSTNGLYTLYMNKNNKKSRIYVCTEDFKTRFMNDVPINTLNANPNLFYKGRHVNIKTFVKKQLTRANIPGKFNDVERDVKTYKDMIRDDFELLSTTELSTMLSNIGQYYTGTKTELIERLINALEN